MDANAPRRGESSAWRPLVVGALVVALVAVVAVASSGSAPSGGIRARRPSEGLVDAVLSLAVLAMGACAVLVVVMLSFFGRYGTDGAPRKRRSPTQSVITFVVAMGTLALFVRAFTGSDGPRITRPGAAGGSEAEAEGGPPAGYEPEFAVWPVLGATALALLALGAWWLSARGRRSAQEPSMASPEEALADVLATTLDDLRAERDPRRAVIGAYARMERALAASGLARRPAEAPDEYLERIVAEVALSRRSAGRLTALFAWARFSGHDVRPEMKDEAIDTLEEVQRELAAAAAAREAERAGAAA